MRDLDKITTLIKGGKGYDPATIEEAPGIRYSGAVLPGREQPSRGPRGIRPKKVASDR
ncbi:MAG TPA: hypothetical protein VEX43_03560 [Chthoniobacterales bacterium]|nr:hypothetical protein [Chthoniobacterales bacterium]